MCCHQFTVQHDIHVPPAAKSKIPSSRARTLTLSNVPSMNREVFAYSISSYKLRQNFHWLPGSRATCMDSALPPHSGKAAYTAQTCSYCSTRRMPTWTARGQQIWITGLLCSFFLYKILAYNYDWQCTKTYCSLKTTYFSTINREQKCILKCGALLLKLSILSRVLWEL